MISIDKVNGLGPRNKMLFEKLNIKTVEDLVAHYPYRYEEMLETPLHDETKVIIEGKLIDEPKVFFKGS